MTASRQEWVSPGMDRNGRCLANEDLLFQDFTVESACLYLRKHFPWMTRLTKIANIVIVLSQKTTQEQVEEQAQEIAELQDAVAELIDMA